MLASLTDRAAMYLALELLHVASSRLGELDPGPHEEAVVGVQPPGLLTGQQGLSPQPDQTLASAPAPSGQSCLPITCPALCACQTRSWTPGGPGGSSPPPPPPPVAHSSHRDTGHQVHQGPAEYRFHFTLYSFLFTG